MAIVDEFVSILGYEIRGEANLKRFENGVRKVAGGVERLTGRIVAYSAAADKAFAASRAMVIPSAIAIFQAKQIKDAGLQMEGWANAFRVVTGSVQGANKELAFAENVADRYGANLVKITGNWVKFRAATKGTDVADSSEEIFQTFSALSSILGQTPDQLDGILLALEQMVSKGKVSAEELRGQLGERLPGAFIAAAKSLGVTTSELDDMLKSGEVVAGDLLPKLAKQLQEDYQINLGDRIDTDIATFQRLENSLFRLRVAIARSGLVEFLADLAQGLTSLANRLADASPMVQKLVAIMITLVAASAPLLWMFGAIAKSISVIMSAALAIRTLAGSVGILAAVSGGTGMIKFLSIFRKNKGLIKAIRLIAAGFGLLTAPITATIAALAALGLGLEDLYVYLQGGESVIGSFIDWFQSANFSQIGESIGGGITEGIQNFQSKLDVFIQQTVRDIVNLLTDPEFYKAGLQIGLSILTGIVSIASALAKAVFDLVAGIFFGIVDKIAGFDVREAGGAFARRVLTGLADGWEGMKARAIGVFFSLVTWLSEIPMFQAGVDMITGLFDGLRSIGSRIKAWFADLLPEWAKNFVVSDQIDAQAADNLTNNLSRVSGRPGFNAGQISNTSNRSSQAVTQTVNIDQHVQQPTNAPGQLAKASAQALKNMANVNRAQLQIEAVAP